MEHDDLELAISKLNADTPIFDVIAEQILLQINRSPRTPLHSEIVEMLEAIGGRLVDWLVHTSAVELNKTPEVNDAVGTTDTA